MLADTVQQLYQGTQRGQPGNGVVDSGQGLHQLVGQLIGLLISMRQKIVHDQLGSGARYQRCIAGMVDEVMQQGAGLLTALGKTQVHGVEQHEMPMLSGRQRGFHAVQPGQNAGEAGVVRGSHLLGLGKQGLGSW